MKKLVNRIVIYMATICLLIIPTKIFAANAVPDAVLESSKSVFRVISDYGDEFSSGSTFIVSKSNTCTYLATNYHVVSDNPKDVFILDGDGNDLDASVYEYDSKKDIAILKVSSVLDGDALVLYPEGAEKGDAIYAVGFPGAADDISMEFSYSNNDVTITDGIVSSFKLGQTIEGANVDVFQVSAAINHGNSGGPLFNSFGEVVGINTYTSATGDVQGIYWAITAKEVINLMDQCNLQYVGHVDSPEQNYSFFIVLAIIVAVVAIIAKRNKKKVGNNAVQSYDVPSVNEVRCPNCNVIMPKGATFCKRCGFRIGEVPKTQTVKIVRYCKNCGNELNDSEKYCRHCGCRIER